MQGGAIPPQKPSEKPLRLFQELGAFVLTYYYCETAMSPADGGGNPLSHGNGDVFAEERGPGSERRCPPAAELHQPRGDQRGGLRVPPPPRLFKAGVVGRPVVQVQIRL